MKLILYLLVLITLVACNPVGGQRADTDDWFGVRRDTVYVEANSSLDSCVLRVLYSVCKCKGKYYLEFGVDSDCPRIFSLSEDFRTLNRLPCPKEFFHYEDLFVRNDSVFSKSEGWPTTWTRYFDEERQQWLDYSERQDKFNYSELFFEDDNYYVSYLPLLDSFGKLIFKDKTSDTNHTYFSSSLVQFLKYKGNYYSIGSYGIYRINDPQRDTLYDSTEKVGLNLGTPLLHLGDFYTRPDTMFYSALISRDTIYELASDSSSTFIAKLENDTLKRVFDFGFDLELADYSPYLHVVLHNQIIKPFYWKSEDGEENSGIMDIHGYDIHLIYFVKRPS